MIASEFEQHLAYWRAHWKQGHPELVLPYDRPRPTLPSRLMRRHVFTSDVQVGRGGELTLLAAFLAILHRYSGQADIRVAVPGEKAFLLLQASPVAQQSFADLRQAVGLALAASRSHPIPLDVLWRAMEGDQQAAVVRVAFCPSGWPLSAVEPFDWVLQTEEYADGKLTCTLVYASELFEAATVERLGEHLGTLLAHASQAPHTRLDQLRLLSPAELHQQQHWNTAALHPKPSAFIPLPQALGTQAHTLGPRVALRQGDTVVSWHDLEERANRLAHRLLAHGVGAEVRVGLSMARSPDMVIALLAILKAGGAFVPLDPGYPSERLAYMCQDAGIRHLLTQRGLDTPWVQTQTDSLDILCIEDTEGVWPATAPAVAIHPAQSAYLIYTSGSTGQPKGVCVEHGPLARHCQAIGQRYQMGPQDKVLHFASINFDLAHEYWLMPLLFGAELLISDPSLWSPAQACTQMARHGTTVAAFPPSYLVQLAEAAHSLLQHPAPDTPAPALRVLAFGGEALSREHFERVRQVFAPATLINGYGPTETVISPMLWTTTPDSDPAQWQHSPYLPIGTAVGNRSAWVLDDSLNPLPVGVAGELYLGGPELARGYHQRPGLSAERFIPDPWGHGSRLYRTGDQVRWRADGGMDYLGRLDHQVKLRGLRIELGEIEARLLACVGVREAAVVVHGEGASAQLLGYWVAQQQEQQQEPLQEEQLRQQLAQQLPEYMVPAQLIQLDALPVTANGKLDRRSLPAPQPRAQERAYRAPRTPMEQALAAIWAEVLQLPRVGLDEHFFALGGHSLLATQVCARVRTQLVVDLSLAVFFEHPVLADMAAVLAREAGAAQQSEAQDLLDMQALLETLES